MYKSLVFTLSVIAFLVAYPASAHPGRTAADGCHYCRTNCDKWGVPWNERHCHNSISVKLDIEAEEKSEGGSNGLLGLSLLAVAGGAGYYFYNKKQ